MAARLSAVLLPNTTTRRLAEMIDARHLNLITNITPHRFLGTCNGPHVRGRDYICGFGPA